MKRKLAVLVMAAALTAACLPVRAAGAGGAKYSPQAHMEQLMRDFINSKPDAPRDNELSFTLNRPVVSADGKVEIETTVIDVPVPALIHVPSLPVDESGVNFGMEVKEGGLAAKTRSHADEAEETDGLSMEECVEILEELCEQGVLVGNELGDPMLDKTVTQGALVKMLSAAQGREPEAAAPEAHWASPWGALAVAQGWMTAEELDYDRELTVGEAAELLSRATGYEADAAVTSDGQSLSRFQAALMVHDILHLTGQE